jgi:hypothetical protein
LFEEIRTSERNIQTSDKETSESSQPWVKTYSGGKPNYTQPIEQHEFIGTIANWGRDFVEVLNPLKENEILRVYHEPSKKEWVGLTLEEMLEIKEKNADDGYVRFAIKIETKLKEKNL